MLPPESLFCPCCASIAVYALSQCSAQLLAQPLRWLGASSLSAAIGSAGQAPVIAPEVEPLSLSQTNEVV
ncbi:MAG: hypothetical protein IGS48_02365 [Oscillatoriales cyanobacterium C42_A2020_001]|nr:hypothetical protein [Leptolyngbyaceae cyanobacterium C42_A2020_001]